MAVGVGVPVPTSSVVAAAAERDGFVVEPSSCPHLYFHMF